MACMHLPHLSSQVIGPPSTPLRIEECGYCFHGVEDGGGLEICAACLVVFCARHAYIHYNKSSHQFSICVRSAYHESNTITPVVERPTIDSDTISLADSRTEVASEAETDETVVGEPEDAGDVQCALRCWQCGVDGEGLIIYVPPEADGADAVEDLIDAVVNSLEADQSQSTSTDGLFPAFLAAMLSTRPFRNRYLPTAPLHFLTCPTRDCLSCYDCQMHKMAAGVLGPASLPVQLPVPIPLATRDLAQLLAPYVKLPSTPGEPPNLFSAFLQAAKALNRTQNQHTPKIVEDVPYTSFHFSVEARTQCTKCLGVRYRTEVADSLLLPACDEVNNSASAEEVTCRALESWLSEADIDFKCTCCDGSQGKLRRRPREFPPVLVVWHPGGSYMPSRGNMLDLEVYRAKGLQPDESELREGRPITPTRPKFIEKPTHLMPPSSPTRNRKRSTSRDLFPSPTRSAPASPTRSKRRSLSPNQATSKALELLRATTPSPNRRTRNMEANLPSPIIRAREELELEEEREKDVGAICALGFEREQVLDALEETDWSLKGAITMLLLWEAQEKENGTGSEEGEEDVDDLDFSEEEEEDEEVEEEEEEEEESSETDDYSDDSLIIDARLKRLTLDSTSSTLLENHGPPVPGRYKLVASIVRGESEAWWVWTVYGGWYAASGILQRVAWLPTEMTGPRLEFWERL